MGRAATGHEPLSMMADRGYFSGEEILACEQIGIAVTLPKPLTSGACQRRMDHHSPGIDSPGLQPEAGHRDPRHWSAPRSLAGLNRHACVRTIVASHNTAFSHSLGSELALDHRPKADIPLNHSNRSI